MTFSSFFARVVLACLDVSVAGVFFFGGFGGHFSTVSALEITFLHQYYNDKIGVCGTNIAHLDV